MGSLAGGPGGLAYRAETTGERDRAGPGLGLRHGGERRLSGARRLPLRAVSGTVATEPAAPLGCGTQAAPARALDELREVDDRHLCGCGVRLRRSRRRLSSRSLSRRPRRSRRSRRRLSSRSLSRRPRRSRRSRRSRRRLSSRSLGRRPGGGLLLRMLLVLVGLESRHRSLRGSRTGRERRVAVLLLLVGLERRDRDRGTGAGVLRRVPCLARSRLIGLRPAAPSEELGGSGEPLGTIRPGRGLRLLGRGVARRAAGLDRRGSELGPAGPESGEHRGPALDVRRGRCLRGFRLSRLDGPAGLAGRQPTGRRLTGTSGPSGRQTGALAERRLDAAGLRDGLLPGLSGRGCRWRSRLGRRSTCRQRGGRLDHRRCPHLRVARRCPGQGLRRRRERDGLTRLTAATCHVPACFGRLTHPATRQPVLGGPLDELLELDLLGGVLDRAEGTRRHVLRARDGPTAVGRDGGLLRTDEGLRCPRGCTPLHGGGVDEQHVRHPDGHQRAVAVLSPGELDPCTEPVRDPTDHEQTQSLRAEHVAGRGGANLLVRLLQLVRGHPEALVLDGHQDVLVVHARADVDRGARLGEHRCVLQDLSEHVRGRQRDVPEHQRVGRQVELDALVVLDLRGRGPDHVGDRQRVTEPTTGVDAGEHQERLRVAAHPGCEVVEPEQVGEGLRVLLRTLEGVDEGQLPVQQDLVTPRHVDEHLRDGGTQRSLLPRHLDRGLVHLVERGRELADLVTGVDRDHRE